MSFAYASPKNKSGADMVLYATADGSYVGKEKSPFSWTKAASVTAPQYNSRREEGVVTVQLDDPVILETGSRRGFYLTASEDVVSFGEGVYRVSDRRGVELYSSRAVSGFFGAGVDGFGLSCEVAYMKDDGTLPPGAAPRSGLGDGGALPEPHRRSGGPLGPAATE